MNRIVRFAAEQLGLQLWPGQQEIVQEFDSGAYSQALWQVGRQSGKSEMSDLMALFDAVGRAAELQPLVPRGKERTIGIVAPSEPQAQRHIQNCARLARNSPAIASLVVGETADYLAFKSGAVIRAFPCSGRGLRGYTASCVVLDEFGHFISSDDGNAAGDTVYEAAVPSLTQFGDAGWLIMISTPRWQQGAFYKQVALVKSGAAPYIHYVHKATLEVNPTKGARQLVERIEKQNPEMYAREYLAQFIDGTSSYLSSVDVVACKRQATTLSPREDMRYVAAIDPAYQQDNFALSIGHKAGGKLVIDGVWTWWRKGHEFTVSEIAGLCREYRVQQVRTDQHAPVPIRESLERHGIAVEYIPWTNERKAEAYSRLKIATSMQSIELPNDDDVIRELCGLEARPTVGGFTRITAAAGGRDDRAIVVASVVQALDRSDQIAVIFAGDDRDMGTADDLDAWTRKLSGSNIFG